MTIPLLILNARPGAGKSEISAFLQAVPTKERLERYNIGQLVVLDDFSMLWTWFEEDAILRQVFQQPGLHTDEEGYFLHGDLLWHLLIRKLCLEYDKCCRDITDGQTILIEFSRGAQHGGYRAAYQHLSDPILQDAACLYVNVSYAESMRKNRKRYNPERPDSILEHSLPDQKLERLYREDDWQEFTSPDPEYIAVREFRLPYVIFENEDDVTTHGGEALAGRLEQTLARLHDLWLDRTHTASKSR